MATQKRDSFTRSYNHRTLDRSNHTVPLRMTYLDTVSLQYPQFLEVLPSKSDLVLICYTTETAFLLSSRRDQVTPTSAAFQTLLNVGRLHSLTSRQDILETSLFI